MSLANVLPCDASARMAGDISISITVTLFPLIAIGEGAEVIEACGLPELLVFDSTAPGKGVITSRNSSQGYELIKQFQKALVQHRFWEREKHKDQIPA